jgi:uncharacterized protein (DUF58 family)
MSEPASPPKLRVRSRPTWAGVAWCAATAALWGTGLYKGINLLTLLSYWLLLLGLLNLAVAGRQLRLLRVRRWTDDAVFAGAPFLIQVEVENGDRRAHLGLRVEDRGPRRDQTPPGPPSAWFISCLDGHARARFRAEVTLPRRGRYEWDAPLLWSGYPFGLLESRLVGGPAQTRLVFPALGRLNRGRLRQFLTRSVAALGQARSRPVRHPAAQGEFHGLRDYRAGDSPRWIHWRTSARRGAPMVREFEDYPEENLILIVEPWLPGAPDKPGTGLRPPSPSPPPSAGSGAVRTATAWFWPWPGRVSRW